MDRGLQKSGQDTGVSKLVDLKNKEKKMSFGRLPVNLSDSTLSAIKKRAFSEGKSASEIARELIESGLENRPGGEGSGSGLDLESLRPIVLSESKKAIWEVREEDGNTKELMKELGLSESPDCVLGLSPEIVRYLVLTLGRLHSLSTKVLSHLPIPGVPDGERKDWLIMEPVEAQEVLKKLNSEGQGGQE